MIKPISPNKCNLKLPSATRNDKIPRFLYHMTPKSVLDNILDVGHIKKTQEYNLCGVFAFDLKNLTKRWSNFNHKCESENLASELIAYTSRGQEDMVILRIPTENIPKSKIKMRSQNVLFDRLLNHYDPKNKGRRHLVSKHIEHGEPATNAKYFTQKKHSIEYIINDEISIDNFEIVGSAKIDRKKFDLKDFLKQVFFCEPEEKCINSLK